MTFALWLQVVGVIASFVAALFLSVAQQGVPSEAGISIPDRLGRQRLFGFVILRYPRLWRAGLILLVVGFGLQLIGYIFTWKEVVQ